MSRLPHRVRFAAILNPRPDGGVDFWPDGVIATDERGTVVFAGPSAVWASLKPADVLPAERLDGVLIPPLLDMHTHVPQHPVRGRFLEGVNVDDAAGRLIAGLNRNVFPAEARCADEAYAEEVVRAFLADTRSHGVFGGAAYMTVHPAAARVALSILPDTWSVGLVLMDRNTPEGLKTDVSTIEREYADLVRDFGRRTVVTDRFAVAVSSPLRQIAAKVAREHGLRTQTHLDEQPSEKRFVEGMLHPDAACYADVYRRDGLLGDFGGGPTLLAHCVQTREREWPILRDTGSAVCHCPTSNALLGSGVMSLDALTRHGIDWALATDVGASPTVSMLTEMSVFLRAHAGRSPLATPSAALVRSTLAPARLLGLADRLGRFAAGLPLTFVRLNTDVTGCPDADAAILRLLGDPSPTSHAASWRRLSGGDVDESVLADLRAEVAARASGVAGVIEIADGSAKVEAGGEIVQKGLDSRGGGGVLD